MLDQPSPRVRTTCPECGHDGQISRDKLGSHVRCPQCESRFEAVEAAPVPEIVTDPISTTRQRPPSPVIGILKDISHRLSQDQSPIYWMLLPVFVLPWGWFDVISNERFPAVPVAVICILGICVCLSNLVPRVRDLGHWQRRLVAVAAAFALIYCWSWFDIYTDTIKGGLTTKYVDRYKFGNDPCRMVVVHHDPDSFVDGIPIFNVAELSIPLTRDGVSHGEGEMILYNPFQKERVFYWYGESVSEGEWHLRNK